MESLDIVGLEIRMDGFDETIISESRSGGSYCTRVHRFTVVDSS